MFKFNELYNTNYQLVLPIETEIMIPKDDSVRLLSKTLEGLDYTRLYAAYSAYGRNPATSPKTLFKILVYAYMNGIYSSRGIEKVCLRDINFMWLLAGEEPPSYSTIARFRKERLKNCMEDLFSQFILLLGELNEITFENLFVDGTKIEANANKYTFVWRKSIEKNQIKLHEKFDKLILNIDNELHSNYLVVDRKYNIEYSNEILVFLKQKKGELNIEFVYGKGRRKTQIQKYIELLEEIIEKETYYDLCNKLFCGRNSFSKTDTDATFMHMKEDHMRNSQLKPGYNIQIGVEAEYIVGVDISSERSDTLTLIPFLNALELNLRRRYLKLIADAGYESEENYDYLETHNIRAFIKPVTYDITNRRSFKNRIGRYENMQYNSDEDTYTCYNSKKLMPIGKKVRKSKSGFQATLTTYECENCSDCTYKSKCTKAQGNRRLDLSKNFIRMRQCSLANIKSQEGIILRTNRSIQAEGAFGVIKEDHNFRRFLLRGQEHVKIEFLLKALAYDVEKLHNKTQQKRNGQQLHCEAIA